MREPNVSFYERRLGGKLALTEIVIGSARLAVTSAVDIAMLKTAIAAQRI